MNRMTGMPANRQGPKVARLVSKVPPFLTLEARQFSPQFLSHSHALLANDVLFVLRLQN